MISLSGYDIVEKIYEGNKSILYRGNRIKDMIPVILKLLKAEYPNFLDIANLKYEYDICRKMDISGAAKVYSMEKYRNSPVLVFEDIKGNSLKSILKKGPLDIRFFLEISIKLIDILELIHLNKIIHKDLNSNNIIINQETQDVRIIDFGNSTQLSIENTTGTIINKFEGTLPYVSPEQTGRMNRILDYRTDFYSLGVTFYEAISGELPFKASDDLEMIHFHIAKNPLPLCNLQPKIPKVLSDIVSKLMEKDAEKRYQSTAGIKNDLLKCLSQIKEKGEIDFFEIAKNDKCGRFNITQKLYGRKQEIDALINTYESICNGMSEMMLVTGLSGIGKSSLVNEIHKPIIEKKGYFISGKYDQHKRNIPYSAIIQAFGELLRQLLSESEETISIWRERLLDTLGKNGQVIIDVIPEVELIIGKQPAVSELSPSESQNRFNLVFQNFCGTFCMEEHPLVVFLDDLHWADLPSLILVETLLLNPNVKSLLIIGAYRDNEVFASHPLVLTIKKIQEITSRVKSIYLESLDLESVNQLLCDTLDCEPKKSLPLAKLCNQKTAGNPFFLTQFLNTLYKDNLIKFDESLAVWEWNIDEIENSGITDNVIEMMINKIQGLPQRTQEVLISAACIGNLFDLQTLSIISDTSADIISGVLWEAFENELILPVGENYKYFNIDNSVKINFKFVHDRIQQAAYSFIKEADKKEVSLKIGRLMLASFSEDECEDKLFEILSHLNFSLELIDSDEEKDKIARLNLIAGKRAKLSAAYESAYIYFSSGINLLCQNGWTTNYNLMLSLHIEGAEAAYLSLKFEDLDLLSKTVIKKANTVLEKIKVYEIIIQAFMAKNELTEVVKTTRSSLNLLGVRLPQNTGLVIVFIEIMKTVLMLLGKKVESLADLPVMTDQKKLAAFRIMTTIILAGVYTDFRLALIVSLKQVRLSIRHGNAPSSAYAFSAYGVLMSGLFGKIGLGDKFGQLTTSLVDKFESKEFKSKALCAVIYNLSFWNKPLKTMISPLLEAYKEALQNGDFEFAATYANYYISILNYAGIELNFLESEMTDFIIAVRRLKQKTIVNYIEIRKQMILNFKNKTENVLLLKGEVYDEEKMLPLHKLADDKQAFIEYFISKYTLCYYFGEYPMALQYLEKMDKYLFQCIVDFKIVLYHFYNALIRLALYTEVKTQEKKIFLKKVKASLKKLKYWLKYCPENLSNKICLVEAELSRVLGYDIKAIECYNKSIELARKEENLREEALANELAGKFFFSKNMNQVAETYIKNAHFCYLKWGAVNKALMLERQYHILLPESVDASPLTTTSTIHTKDSEILDMASILKATQAISGEIVFEKLLKKLVQIVLENAGAQKVILVLKRDNCLFIEAIGSILEEEINIMKSIKVDENSDIPLSIINYVNRTKESIVLDDVEGSDRFVNDAYIIKRKPKSILCTPVINKGNVTGILYLENNSVAGAFTGERIKILNILASQLAISMENANLYTHLDELVIARTSELSEALKNLKQTQTQLVEAEKMSALGQIVAGVAHEINTPTGVAITSASFLDSKTKQFMEVYESKQMRREDFENFLKICSESSKIILLNVVRAGELIKSFKQVAVDQLYEDIREFNVKEYVEHILLSLMPKLKQAKHKVSLICDENLKITSYPGAIAQIITNLIMNSLIHAYDEGVQGNITLDIFFQKDKLIFKYADDGKGIKQEYMKKIFEPFFTTNRGKGGSGLGLNIVYNVVTRKLSGTIKCLSEVDKGTTFIIELPAEIGK